MPTSQAAAILRHVQRLAAPRGEQTDGQLLRRFIDKRDEIAFTALLQRHGQLVWNVCRRILHREHDAEDAFQATFLVLARRAAAIRKRESAASWLYGVAQRIAVRAKHATEERRQRERQAVGLTIPLPPSEAAVRELQAVLDEEVLRLPGKYRVPFVLCCLQGTSWQQAAAALGCKEGTVASRIARARGLLQERLARRGFTLSAALTASVLWGHSASACVPVAVLKPTVQAALLVAAGKGFAHVVSPAVAALLETGAKTLTATKMKIAAALLLAASFVGGVGWALGQRLEGEFQIGRAKEPRPKTQEPRAENPKPKTDSFGDPLPPDAIARLGRARWQLDGHHAESLAVSPDGKTLVSVNANKGITVFDVATGKVLRQIPQTPELRKEWLARDWLAPSALSGDAGTVALAPSGDAVYVIDVASGKARYTFKSPGRVARLALSGDGHVLAALTYEGHLQVWDTARGEMLRELSASRKLDDPHKPQWLALSSDGKTVAYVGEDEACPIHVVDLTTGKERHRLGEHERDSRHVTMAPDGKLLAASSSGGLVQLWDVEEGKIRHKWAGKKDGPEFPMTAFSPDGKTLIVTRGRDHALRLLDTVTGKEVFQIHRRYSSSVADAYAFAPDGKTLYLTQLGSPIINRYDPATGKLVVMPGEMGYRFRDVIFTADEATVFSASDDGMVRRWEIATGKVARVPMSRIFGSFSPDGALLAQGTRDGFELLELATSKVRLRGIGYSTFSRDGRRVAAVGQNEISIFETATGQEISKLPGRPSSLHHVEFTPDGKRLAVLAETGDGFVLRFWDIATGKELKSLPMPRCDASTLLFSPDGRTVVVGLPPGFLPREATPGFFVVELATGQQRQHVRIDKILPGYSWPPTVYFSPSGEFLLIGDSPAGVSIIDPLTGELLYRRQDHRGDVFRMVFSPSNRRLATIAGDGTVLVWNTADFLRPARPKPLTLSDAEQASGWDDLANADATRAALTMRRLTRSVQQSVPLLGERLRPAVAIKLDAKKLEQLLAGLDSDQFDTRKQAEAEFEKLGEAARPALEKTLVGQPSTEVRRAVERLMAKLDPSGSPSTRRMLRAVEVLESIATPEARRVLESLAKGAPDARLTREAKVALDRLAARTAQE